MDFRSLQRGLINPIRSLDEIHQGQSVFYRRGQDIRVCRFVETAEPGWLRNHVQVGHFYSRSCGYFWAACQLIDSVTGETYNVEVNRSCFELPRQFGIASIYEISQGTVNIFVDQLQQQISFDTRTIDSLRSAL